MQVLSWLERAVRLRPSALLALLVVAGCLVAPGSAAAEATIHTATTVTCGSSILFVNKEESCIVRVRSLSGGTPPGGTVKLAAEGGHITSTCSTVLLPFLLEGFCVGAYVPQKGGSYTVTASYVGDSTHLPSTGSTTVAVSDTVTTVDCGPEGFSVLEQATCTAEAHNAGAASDSLSGTLSFELPRGGKLDPSSCNLGESNGCTLKFSAPVADLYQIIATYSGDATHPASTGHDTIFGREVSITTVDCGSAVHFPGDKVECEARTNGGRSGPNHGDTVVRLTAEGREVASCLLALQSEVDASCRASFTAEEAGLQTVTADYPGDILHLPSSGQTTVVVSDTATRVQCQPESISVGESSLCTAEVRNTGGASDELSGAVRFGSNQSGRFEPSGCDISESNPCTVTYFPAVGSQHLVTAFYSGDATHPASHSDATALSVLGTSVKLGCAQEGPAIPETATCTAHVVNEGLGSPSLSGTVRFTTSNAGSFSSRECTLVPSTTEGGGSCSTHYTLEEKGVHVIRAFYSGDDTHPPATDGTAELTSQFPPTTTRFGCLSSPPVGEETECILRVSDDSISGATPPTGPVVFSPERKSGEFLPCPELEPINSTESICFTAYRPTTTESRTLTAKYQGDKFHGPSQDSIRLIHPTTTEVDCGRTSPLGAVVTCTATVHDSDGVSAPRGVVSFTSSVSGEFSQPDCTLEPTASPTSVCSVSLKTFTATTYVITATYGSDLTHHSSVGTTNLEVRSG